MLELTCGWPFFVAMVCEVSGVERDSTDHRESNESRKLVGVIWRGIQANRISSIPRRQRK